MRAPVRPALRPLALLAFLLGGVLLGQSATEPKRLEVKDAQRLLSIRSTALSPDGAWLGYQVNANRGRGFEFEQPEEEPSEEEPVAAPVGGVILRHLSSGKESTHAAGTSFQFSPDSQWVLITESARGRRGGGRRGGGRRGAERRGAEAGERRAEASAEAPAEPKKEEAPKAEPAPEEPAQSPQEVPEPGRGGRGNVGRRGGRVGAAGGTVTLRHLGTNKSRTLRDVSDCQFTRDGRSLMYVSTARQGSDQGIFLLELDHEGESEPQAIVKGSGQYRNLSWSDDARYLTFFSNRAQDGDPSAAAAEEEEAAEETAKAAPKAEPKPAGEGEEKAASGEGGAPSTEANQTRRPRRAPRPPTRLYVWDRTSDKVEAVVAPGATGFPKDHELASTSAVWSPDRSRVFVRLSKIREGRTETGASGTAGTTLPPEIPERFRNLPPEMIERFMSRFGGAGVEVTPPSRSEGTPTSRRGAQRNPDDNKPKLDVWHWKDQQIAPMRTRRGGRAGFAGGFGDQYVADVSTGALRKLTDERLANLDLNHLGTYGIASDDDLYEAERTWDQPYSDYYVVSVEDGSVRRLFEKVGRGPRWTSDGRFLLWQEDGALWRIDPETLERVNLTAASKLTVSDDGTRGAPTGGRGRGRSSRTALLLPKGRELLFSDGHDLWALPLDGSVGRNLTRDGRDQQIRYSHVVTDPDQPFVDDRWMLVSSFDLRTKAGGFHRLDLRTGRMETLLVLDKNLGSLTVSKAQNRVVFTVETSDQFPDLWTADGDFRDMRRVTNVNAWLSEHALPKSDLVTWRSADGDALEGMLLKPANYVQGRRYPTIVFIYERQSDRLHRFQMPGLQMNPQAWAQDGYAVFMPDIVYQIGRPGLSAVKCVVPGVQKLIDLGITDPDRVGLCGHSWGGYETAFIITQTRLFAAAIAGAPVVNMTSAYNGIRWQTGLPRQFQYEKAQSRIGGSLWEYPERFIANSPVFHMDNVTTPVLIMFGNNDGAVPWYQGIEYYLAMRRLNKPAVLLEYKDEGHGLRRRPNQEDYTQRIGEWFGHYLKGEKAADWIRGPEMPKPLVLPEVVAPPAVTATAASGGN